MSWLDLLLEQTEEAESPEQFVYWSGLCAISAVVRKNVYLNRHIYNLYPNLYVMLVAKPGGRKGFPVGLARKLVTLTQSTRIISGQNSIQAIIQELSTTYTSPNGTIVDKAHCFLNSDEFTNLIIDDPGSLAILTQLYDTHANEPEWKKTLRGGSETLKDPCITLLGASNPSYFNNRITAVDATGGFLSRMVLVIDNSRDKINPLTTPPKHKLDIGKLAIYLQELARIKGEFSFTDDGRITFERWYETFRKENTNDEIGIGDRLHEQVLKVAMCVSLSENTSLLLTENHIKFAISICNRLAGKAKQFWEGKGISEIAPQCKVVINYLLDCQEFTASRRKLLRERYTDLDHFTLDRVIQTLEEGNILKTQIAGPERYYTLTPLFIQQYQDCVKDEKREKAN